MNRRSKIRSELPAELVSVPRRRSGEANIPIPAPLTKAGLVGTFSLALALLVWVPTGSRASGGVASALGIALGVGGFVLLLAHYYLAVRRQKIASTRRLVAILGAALGLSATAKVACAVGFWPPFLFPVVLASILFTILFGREVGLELTLLAWGLVALVVSIERPGSLAHSLPHTLAVLVPGSVVAVLGGARVQKRSTLVNLGLAIGLVHVAGHLVASFAAGDPTPWRGADFGRDVTWAFGHGLAAGFILAGLLPLVEVAFQVTTDISLLELSNLSHPLLTALSIRAPGTYHHSLLVGQMAETAAESIGANGLLCRVGAYYHDIGKILRPAFFVENGFHHADSHRAVSPAMSALVILAHVKDGEELGRLYRLPEAILDFIREHQGTGTIDLFFRRALEDLGPKGVDRARFSYPGPRPRSIEVGIVALADSVEAASRYLEDPNPASVKKTVANVFSKKMTDGLLDDAPITLRQLRRIEDSFVRVLLGVFHSRGARVPEAPAAAPSALEIEG